VFDITETLPFLSYKLLHRSMGASEIATDDRLATSTIDSFDRLDQIMSVWRLVFPWMLTPSCIDKYVAGAKLYFSICSILNQRKKSGYFPDDGLTFAWNEYGNEVEAVKVSKIPLCIKPLVRGKTPEADQ
jgi:hypothetical protein